MSNAPLNILIVEDEALVAMALEIEIEDHGHASVGPLARVDDALALIERDHEKIDGAILDVMLGREEVFPVADRLRHFGVPFVFHSGHLDRAVIDGRYDAPCHSKPALPEELIGSLVSILG